MEMPKAPLGVLTAITSLTIAGSMLSGELPTDTSTIFSGSGNCATCHVPSSISPAALVDPVSGADVSPPALWRSTMMANAAKDPFWQAKVSAEVAANPHLKEIIEDKCTTCHAPTGRTEAASRDDLYSLEEMREDPLALDGVTCTACHQIKDQGLGTPESFSGKYVIENDRLIYGPFDDQFTMPMNGATNYVPVYSEHVTRSELCATCHTLFTPFVDNSGEIAGEFPEQVPYLEWKNSVYPDQDRQCQDCHMPAIDDEIPISAIPPNTTPRGPFAKHFFVGGNVTMLRLLQENIDELGITADPVDFDSTIARTVRQLQHDTAELSAEHTWIGDTLAIDVMVVNKAGHKLPTGYPSRRMWLNLTVRDAVGSIVFTSGDWNEEGRIAGMHTPFVPHRNTIVSPDQVQVYETVLADVDGDVTYTLLRGSRYAKDNRIPPSGFTTAHQDYGFAAVTGAAAEDPDFNRAGDSEGSGSDIVHYRIEGLQKEAGFSAEVKLVYQSIAPNWIDDLEAYETEEAAAFNGYYEDADVAPIILGSIELSTVNTASGRERPETPDRLVIGQNFPNPFSEWTTIPVTVAGSDEIVADLFDLRGRRIRQLFNGYVAAGRLSIDWDGKDALGVGMPAGTYLVRVSTLTGSQTLLVQKSP